MENNTLIKAMNKKELIALYKVSYKTFNAWLKPFDEQIGKPIGKFYTPKQIALIFELLGPP